jgi:hypothetical protein
MTNNHITSSDLMDLARILSSMVSSSRLTEIEAIQLLSKAGLTRGDSNQWVDEVGSKYSTPSPLFSETF